MPGGHQKPELIGDFVLVIIACDRAMLDFAWWQKAKHLKGLYFVTRPKILPFAGMVSGDLIVVNCETLKIGIVPSAPDVEESDDPSGLILCQSPFNYGEYIVQSLYPGQMELVDW